MCIAVLLRGGSTRPFHRSQVRAQALQDRDELRAFLARDARAISGAELLGHVIDLVDDAEAGIGDRDELDAAVVAPARALDESFALEPLDQRARCGLAHAESPREVRLGELLAAFEMDQRRHLALMETGAAKSPVVHAELQARELGDQELELLIRIAALHEACLGSLPIVWY